MKATPLLLLTALFIGQMSQAQEQKEVQNKGNQAFLNASGTNAASENDQIAENNFRSTTYSNTDMASAERHNDGNNRGRAIAWSTLKPVSKVSLDEGKFNVDGNTIILPKTGKNNSDPLEAYSTYMADPDSESSGFGPAYYREEIVFASDRNTERPIYNETKRPFLDLYEAKIKDGNMTAETLFPGDINTDLHESNAVFTKDGNTMYFTRNNDKYKRINGMKTAVLQIFRAEFIDGKWQNIKPLSISSNAYSVAHPSLSADEKTLYFSSDMPGGLGASDIYKVSLIEKEKCGSPVNLGPSVNSNRQEQFPFISEKGNLFFASDRNSGYGGLDLYRSQRENSTFSPALNMGESINSATDDFSLITKEGKGTGYFSSNRTGKDKIYRFDKDGDAAPAATVATLNGKSINGNVTDANTGRPIIGVKVSLSKPDGTVLRQTYVNRDGSFDLPYDQDGEYILEFGEWMYKKSTIRINWTRTNVDAPKLALKLEPKNPNAPQYDPETAWTAGPKTNKASTVNPVKPKLDLKKLDLDNVYFDFDNSVINPEAAKTLDKLAALLKENNTSTLNINAYADKSGPDSYNQRLSERRAKAAIKYLVKKGVAKECITSHAYGESKALEEGMNPENRKCEFKIVAMN